ncbi:hypothetical protein IMSAG049_01441 [Clostridiales bacterium]|nr:hypothetical protein IMSAG049_01441 [Clostridiales bacterium]
MFGYITANEDTLSPEDIKIYREVSAGFAGNLG